MLPEERVFKVWHALYFFRIWRKWVESYRSTEPLKYKLYDNFISENAFTCLELNAYGLLHLIKKLRNANQSHLFLIALFNSQPCENIFRQLRSMTTANWTKINFSLLELLHMISRIEMQNDIAYFKLREIVTLPRINNQLSKHKLFELPTDEKLQNVLQQALDAAVLTASEFGMNTDDEKVRFCELSKRALYVRKPKNGGLEVNDEANSDSIRTVDCTYCRQYANDAEELDSRFIQVHDNDGTMKVIRKSSLVWLLTDNANKLSKDRLQRVKGSQEVATRLGKKKKWNHLDMTQNKVKIQSFEVLKEIQVGQWCVFKNQLKVNDNSTNDGMYGNLVIGSILGFKYIRGKNEKEKQYSLDAAPVSYDQPNKRGVEVLALWYHFNSELILEPLKNPSFFINIEHYVANAPRVMQNYETKSYEFIGNSGALKNDLAKIIKHTVG